jgi:hypothetical protein
MQQETQAADIGIMVCVILGVRYFILIYTHHQELRKLVGSHGMLSLLIHDEDYSLTCCE